MREGHCIKAIFATNIPEKLAIEENSLQNDTKNCKKVEIYRKNRGK